MFLACLCVYLCMHPKYPEMYWTDFHETYDCDAFWGRVEHCRYWVRRSKVSVTMLSQLPNTILDDVVVELYFSDFACNNVV